MLFAHWYLHYIFLICWIVFNFLKTQSSPSAHMGNIQGRIYWFPQIFTYIKDKYKAQAKRRKSSFVENSKEGNTVHRQESRRALLGVQD